jgi:hypothetical protein
MTREEGADQGVPPGDTGLVVMTVGKKLSLWPSRARGGAGQGKSTSNERWSRVATQGSERCTAGSDEVKALSDDCG